jgi:predicted metalloprotease with PDZ domain
MKIANKIKSTATIFFIILLVLHKTVSSQKYEYKVDLINVKNDKIFVELKCPPIGKNEVLFHFASMDPGHSQEFTNFGKYIEDLKAFDSNGEELKTEKTDDNTFRILNSVELNKISYLVNDTWDPMTKDTKTEMYELAKCVGTNFEAGKNYVINTGGLFGFFDDLTDIPFDITFTKPSEMFGVTAIKTTKPDENTQCFKAQNYDHLFDSPILFSKPDTINFTVGNCKFTIGVYSELEKPMAHLFAENVKRKMMSVKQFIGGAFPVDHYVFLFFITDITELEDFIIQSSDFGMKNTKKFLIINKKYRGYGKSAIEHNFSSFFSLAARSENQYSFDLMDFIIHEFMHVYAPKSLHSDLLGNFNYTNPELSAHRWLYEGVTEYLAGLIKLKGGLYDINQFLQEFMRPKIQFSYNFPDTMTFIEFSKNANKPPYTNQYGQSYFRGPLLAMLLDFEIMRLTDGEKGLREVFFALHGKYKGKSFKEDGIIPAFVEEVHPDLQLFFDKYIAGSESLKIEEGFNSVGIKYEKEVIQRIPKMEFSAVPLWDLYCFKKVNTYKILKKGDKIRIQDFGRKGWKVFTKPDGEFIAEGETVTLPIIRDGEKISVSFPAKFIEGTYKNKISVSKNMTEIQDKLFNKWVSN